MWLEGKRLTRFVMWTRWMSSSGNRQCLAAQAVMLLPGSARSKAMHTLRGSGSDGAVSMLPLLLWAAASPPSTREAMFLMDRMRIFSLRADCRGHGLAQGAAVT